MARSAFWKRRVWFLLAKWGSHILILQLERPEKHYLVADLCHPTAVVRVEEWSAFVVVVDRVICGLLKVE